MYRPACLATFLLAAALTACTGNGGPSLPVSVPTATPTSGGGLLGSTGPSGPAYAFGGSSASGNFSSGVLPPFQGITLAAYKGIVLNLTFGSQPTGSGTLVVSDALNGAQGVSDVQPNLPPDTSHQGYTAVFYGSIWNGGSQDINFGSWTPYITLTGANLVAQGYVECFIDTWALQYASQLATGWNSTNISDGVPSGSGTEFQASQFGGPLADFKAGTQQIFSIVCTKTP
jgi:hypothetical protein